MTAFWTRFLNRRTVSVSIGAMVLAAIGISAWFAVRQTRKLIVLRGAVVQFSQDASQQSPITDVDVSAADDLARAEAKSDFSGYFSLTLQPSVKRGDSVTLHFQHPDYLPLDLTGTVGDELFVAHLKPVKADAEAPEDHPQLTIGNVVVRYSLETTSSANIGSGVKIFQVVNTGNIPCNHARVCSPDGKWKASTGEAALDAGAGNEFRDARVSCIAGPCPFTKIDSDGFSAGGRMISVAIRDWSDSTTFVLQAEAFRVQVYDLVRQYYPTIIGRTVNFSLPAGASGLTVEAEVNGTDIDFALGPRPVLSWADCRVSEGRDHVAAYRCELKPWCRFRQKDDGSGSR
jgi:hypothetical protein